MSESRHADEVERLAGLARELLQHAGPGANGDVLSLLQRLELTLPQILSLSRMRLGPQTVSSLAAELRLTPGAVSRLVDQLVARGLVLREEGELDRRCKTLRLAAEGRHTIDRLEEARHADFARLCRKLDPALREELARVLERVVAAVQERDSSPENAP